MKPKEMDRAQKDGSNDTYFGQIGPWEVVEISIIIYIMVGIMTNWQPLLITEFRRTQAKISF